MRISYRTRSHFARDNRVEILNQWKTCVFVTVSGLGVFLVYKNGLFFHFLTLCYHLDSCNIIFHCFISSCEIVQRGKFSPVLWLILIGNISTIRSGKWQTERGTWYEGRERWAIGGSLWANKSLETNKQDGFKRTFLYLGAESAQFIVTTNIVVWTSREEEKLLVLARRRNF